MSLNAAELEEHLARLESVEAVRVVTHRGQVVEVHVIAPPDKPAKQVVRDVQTLALARFGTPIDRRVISVVRIAAETLSANGSVRPVLADLAFEPEGSRVTVRVALRRHDEQHVGQATGPAVPSARLRLVGEATLAAVEHAYEDLPPLALDAIGPTQVGGRVVVVAVVVSAGRDGKEEATVGSALSTGDQERAAVRAVLDALNRRLTLR